MKDNSIRIRGRKLPYGQDPLLNDRRLLYVDVIAASEKRCFDTQLDSVSSFVVLNLSDSESGAFYVLTGVGQLEFFSHLKVFLRRHTLDC